MPFCISCGEVLQFDSKFCTGCGLAVGQSYTGGDALGQGYTGGDRGSKVNRMEGFERRENTSNNYITDDFDRALHGNASGMDNVMRNMLGESASSKSAGSSYSKQEPQVTGTRCNECNIVINGPAVQINSNEGLKTFHQGCLKCSKCRQSCGNQFNEVAGEILCGNCTPDSNCCPTCSKSISGRFVKALGKEFHPDCFQCFKCHTSLNGKPYAERPGGAICQNCR